MTALTTPDGTAASRFAFGTMQFGGNADEADSRAMFDACRAVGINHFDTATSYTGGRSEEILGQLIKDERDSLLIATKVGYHGGANAENMQKQFDASRSRLGLDVVDVLYLHRFDSDTPLEHTMEVFAGLKGSGAIRYIGLSNFAAWQVMKAQAIGPRVDILQPMYNLVKRQVEVEILPMAADQEITVAPYSPLGGGLLTGKYASGKTEGRLIENTYYNARYGVDWMHDTAAELAQLGEEIGVSPATLAVAWVAAHPTGPVPIISARNLAQLQPSLDAIAFDMNPALYDQITGLSMQPPPATDRIEEAVLGDMK
ncbi:MAG: aldo/keto reductase [Paracoccaceae bacterium]